MADIFYEFLKNKQDIDNLLAKVKELKEEGIVLEKRVVDKMKESNEKSNVFYGKRLSLKKSKDVKIYDEEALLREFATRKDVDFIGEFTRVKVDSIKFKRFSKKLLEEKNQLMPGTEVVEKENLKVTDLLGDVISL